MPQETPAAVRRAAAPAAPDFADKNRSARRFPRGNCNAPLVDHHSTSDSWRAWLEANGRRFLLFARDQTRCEADAHDVLQDALVQSWRRHAHGPPPDALVFATIRRRAIDLARSNDRRERRELAAPEWFAADDAGPSLDAELDRAVMTLPPNLREVLVLKTWGGLTFQDIAATLGVPLNTAASRYRYALERLRETMKEARS
jgi:RNA polymerase sigma-70 factor (ECF subfamily)